MLLFKKHDSNAKIPLRMTSKSAGFDLYSLDDVVINPYQTVLIDTGIGVEFPDGYFGAVEGRSSLAKQQISCHSGTSKLKISKNNNTLIFLFLNNFQIL